MTKNMRIVVAIGLVVVLAVLLFWLGACTPAERQAVSLGTKGICVDPTPFIESALAADDASDAGDDGAGEVTLAFAVKVPRRHRAKRCACADAGSSDAGAE